MMTTSEFREKNEVSCSIKCNGRKFQAKIINISGPYIRLLVDGKEELYHQDEIIIEK
jgi:hypothetical protein